MNRKILNVFTLQKEARKYGVLQAAKDYDSVFKELEKEFNESKKFFEEQSLQRQDLATRYLEYLKILEDKRKYLEFTGNECIKDDSRNINLIDENKGNMGLVYIPDLNYLYKLFEYSIGGLYKKLKAPIEKAYMEGYIEQKNIYIKKIDDLKDELRKKVEEGEALLEEYNDLIYKTLVVIADKQIKMMHTDFLYKCKAINDKNKRVNEDFSSVGNEINRVRNVVQNAETILTDLDKEFSELTGLNKTDFSILMIAVGLQVARQCLINNTKFNTDEELFKKFFKKALESNGDKKDWQKILSSDVPYDAILNENSLFDKDFIGIDNNYKSLGHDPIWGWIFGTANILTDSLTTNKLKTYQVENMFLTKEYESGTIKMLWDALVYSLRDYRVFVSAVARQSINFAKSDYFTEQGLSLPNVSMIKDDTLIDMLNRWNIDLYIATKDIFISTFINMIIMIVHQLFYNEKVDINRDVYEVRTRKILSYSNMLASSGNMLYVYETMEIEKIDFGGMLVSLNRIINDYSYKEKIKEDFVKGKFRDIIIG